MKVWILQKRNSEYSKYISILNIYENELEALRELNKMTDRFDIEVVGYEVIKQSINEGVNLPFYGGRIKDKK